MNQPHTHPTRVGAPPYSASAPKTRSDSRGSIKRALRLVLAIVPLATLIWAGAAGSAPHPSPATPQPKPQSTNKPPRRPIGPIVAQPFPGRTGGVAQPTPTPVAPLRFTLAADRTNAHPGEDVNFTLKPSRDTGRYPFAGVFNFQEGPPMKVSGLQTVYQFRKAGSHTISAEIARDNPGVILRAAAVVQWPEVVNKVVVQVSPIDLNVKNTAAVGENLTFSTNFRSSDRSIVYRFVFDERSGEQSPWSPKPSTTFVYPNEGIHLAHAEVGRANGRDIQVLTASDSEQIRVDPVRPGALSFKAEPNRVDINVRVAMTARFNSRNPNVRYRFDFDDGQRQDWQDSGYIEHYYKSSGAYQPYAEVGLFDGRQTRAIQRSKPDPVNVNAPPPPTPTPTPRPTQTPTPGRGGPTPTFTPTPFPSPTAGGNVGPTPGASPGTTPGASPVGNGSPTPGTGGSPGANDNRSSGPNQNGNRGPGGGAGGGTNDNGPGNSGGGGSSLPPGSTGNGIVDWLPVLGLIGIGVIGVIGVIGGAGYVTYRSLKAAPAGVPTLVPHPDVGRSQVESASGLSIDFELRVNRDVERARYRLDAPEAGLVKGERRSNE